ncbi:COLL7-like protein [Mya arenaria]|uniref:COLL7-like protein n=1 Tax=Mya arenaria TaxID=6604 RepID=A0ABY7DDC6_MYAAR|nr:COLL7-like protein [Mya arenaria]
MPGPPGIKGNVGMTGDWGMPGIQGIAGVPGDVGFYGEAGPMGEPGFRGPEGEMGLKGPNGERGEQGDIGQWGSVGSPGSMYDPYAAMFGAASAAFDYDPFKDVNCSETDDGQSTCSFESGPPAEAIGKSSKMAFPVYMHPPPGAQVVTVAAGPMIGKAPFIYGPPSLGTKVQGQSLR